MSMIAAYMAGKRQNYMDVTLLRESRRVQRLEYQSTRIARLRQFLDQDAMARLGHRRMMPNGGRARKLCRALYGYRAADIDAVSAKGGLICELVSNSRWIEASKPDRSCFSHSFGRGVPRQANLVSDFRLTSTAKSAARFEPCVIHSTYPVTPRYIVATLCSGLPKSEIFGGIAPLETKLPLHALRFASTWELAFFARKLRCAISIHR